VAPGFVDTELTRDLPEALKEQIRAATPLARFGTTDEIASAIAFLASDEAAYITGQILAVDGGLVMMQGAASRQGRARNASTRFKRRSCWKTSSSRWATRWCQPARGSSYGNR